MKDAYRKLGSAVLLFFLDFSCVQGAEFVDVRTHNKAKQHVVLVFDLDDTLIGLSRFDVLKRNLLIGWRAFPSNVSELLKAKRNRKKNSYGEKKFFIRGQFAPGGGSTSFAYFGLHGGCSPQFQGFIPDLLAIHWCYIDYLPGAYELMSYLKQIAQDPARNITITIAYATNKDCISYLDTVNVIDKKRNNFFSASPDIVLVTQPKKSWIAEFLSIKNKALPAPFKKFVSRIAGAKEDSNKKIFFAHGFEKPDRGYFKRLSSILNQRIVPAKGAIDKIIFFDDKKVNVSAAKEAKMYGYVIKKTEDIIKALVDQGVLSAQKDHLLLKKFIS